MNRRAIRSRGFTLLEVMLALMLTSLVLAALATAINIHLRLVDSNRTGVEEAQLARVMLNLIAGDLRNAVYSEPVDVDSLAANMISQVEEGMGMSLGDANPAGAAALEGFLEEELGGTGESDTGGTTEPTDLTTLQSEPGLYGNTYQLQVDTSRLPRADELQGMVSPDAATVGSVSSDVKTVSYYVLDDQTALGSSASGSGLVRREYDRATVAWASQQGQLLDLDQEIEPIAPEVAAIEFRYFDGTELLEEWDSSVRKGLPLAVEVAIGIIPAKLRNDTELTALRNTSQLTLAESEDLLVYRKLVFLPTAKPSSATDASMSTDAAWEGFDDASSESAGGDSRGGGSVGGGSVGSGSVGGGAGGATGGGGGGSSFGGGSGR